MDAGKIIVISSEEIGFAIVRDIADTICKNCPKRNGCDNKQNCLKIAFQNKNSVDETVDYTPILYYESLSGRIREK